MADNMKLELLQLAGSALIGFLAALATFRARFVSLDAKNASAAQQRDSDRAADAVQLTQLREALAASNRRQIVILELVVDMANKAGVNNRFSDLIPRLLSEGGDNNG